MASLVSEIKSEVEKGAADLRKSAPALLAKLGVNQEDEHAIFHAVLEYLLKSAGAAVAAESTAILNGDL